MKYNRILRQITYELFQERPAVLQEHKTNYRIERASGGLLCDLWFLTTGCIHDAQGGCVMCNYGKNEQATTQAEQTRIAEELHRIVKALPWTFEDFLLTSSGSLLDKREVSQSMWDRLACILKDVRAKHFIVETRADMVTKDSLRLLTEVMPDSKKFIEIGLESSSNWVLKHCINKASTFEDFCAAIQIAHEQGVSVVANVGLGFPFMSESASISNTVQTIRDTFQAGADSVVLFPYHIKRWTLLDKMYRWGMYDCISLWALAEVLAQFPQEMEKIQISWYKDYFGEEGSYIYRSPGTCQTCGARVLEELDRYRETQSGDCIERLWLDPCRCHLEWKERLQAQPKNIEIQHVEQIYRSLVKRFSVDQDILEQELFEMKREYEELVK